jgi:hypothetical protein
MDETTQQNAALVEQAAAAAESLEEQARNMMEAVSAFKLSAGQEGLTERRGPSRATNVERLPQAKPAAKAATKQAMPAAGGVSKKLANSSEDEWEEF